MKKSYIILIIVSVLIILFITGYFISQNIYFDNGEIPEESGDEDVVEMIFNDVSENHWASKYILFLTQRKIMFVSGDGYFYPNNSVKIKEFIEILMRVSMGRIDLENMSGDDYINILVANKILEENEISIENFDDDIKALDYINENPCFFLGM